MNVSEVPALIQCDNTYRTGTVSFAAGTDRNVRMKIHLDGKAPKFYDVDPEGFAELIKANAQANAPEETTPEETTPEETTPEETTPEETTPEETAPDQSAN